MANPDLRDWIAQMEAAGELQKVSGADRKEEIGGIVDIYQRQTDRPALLFDDIPGYPKGYRVAANILTGVKRIALTFGMPAESTRAPLTPAVTGRAASASLAEGAEMAVRAAAPAGARGAVGCVPPAPAAEVPARGGQMTPSQLRSLHL